MRIKKLVAYLITLCLILSCAACGNSESGSGNKGEDTASPTSANDTNADNKDSENSNTDNQAPEDFDEDLEEIIMTYPIIGTVTQNGAQEVEDAINAISEKENNVHVTLKPIELGNYAQQVNLMITGNETLDIVCTFPSGSSSFSSMCSQNQLIPLDDLVEEYGTDIKTNLGELLNAT